MNIIPLNFSCRKLYEIAAEFAENYEYDLPISDIEVIGDKMIIHLYFYNSPLHKSFSCYYVLPDNEMDYEAYSKAIEECFKGRALKWQI